MQTTLLAVEAGHWPPMLLLNVLAALSCIAQRSTTQLPMAA
jgi:hypothetical protein